MADSDGLCEMFRYAAVMWNKLIHCCRGSQHNTQCYVCGIHFGPTKECQLKPQSLSSPWFIGLPGGVRYISGHCEPSLFTPPLCFPSFPSLPTLLVPPYPLPPPSISTLFPKPLHPPYLQPFSFATYEYGCRVWGSAIASPVRPGRARLLNAFWMSC